MPANLRLETRMKEFSRGQDEDQRIAAALRQIGSGDVANIASVAIARSTRSRVDASHAGRLFNTPVEVRG